jgi:hypothetical protein
MSTSHEETGTIEDTSSMGPDTWTEMISVDPVIAGDFVCEASITVHAGSNQNEEIERLRAEIARLRHYASALERELGALDTKHKA